MSCKNFAISHEPLPGENKKQGCGLKSILSMKNQNPAMKDLIRRFWLFTDLIEKKNKCLLNFSFHLKTWKGQSRR